MSGQKILVLGGGGMLGHKLCQLLPAHGFEVCATLRRPLRLAQRCPGIFDRVALFDQVDVLAPHQLEQTIEIVAPDVIVNCIGIVKQLPAAEDRYLSVAINALLPHRLAKHSVESNRRLIHISTDCVFDGLRGGYRETDPSDARDDYGKSKFLGETTEHETAALTLRTSIIGRELGESSHGLLEWFLAQTGGKVKGFSRAIYSGLTTHELAKVIAHLCKQFAGPRNVAPDLPDEISDSARLHGLFHVASAPISKYDLLCLIRRVYDLEIEIARDEDFVCDRSLIMDRFSAVTGYTAPDWEQMIAEMHADPINYDVWKQMCQHKPAAAA